MPTKFHVRRMVGRVAGFARSEASDAMPAKLWCAHVRFLRPEKAPRHQRPRGGSTSSAVPLYIATKLVARRLKIWATRSAAGPRRRFVEV